MRNQQRTTSISYIETAIFILLWVVVLLSPVMGRGENSNVDWNRLPVHWMRMAPFVIISMLNHFLLVPFLFFRKKKWLYLISTFSVVAILYLASPAIDQAKAKPIPPPVHAKGMMPPPKQPPPEEVRPRHQPPPPEREQGMLPPRLNFLLIALIVLGFDTGLRTAFRWSKTDQERLQLEKENINNQLAMLRNQVNPHFFMNTLNNIHALIDIDAPGAKEAIIRLSRLMRHLLYDSDVELNPISKEIEFIESYIDLMRLRYSDKVSISLEIPDKVPDKKIPPLLFTSLLENAFKHGISYATHSFVHATIHFTKDQLIFEIKNSIVDTSHFDAPSGIGIENTKKRLELLYPNQYELEFSESGNEFSVRLVIPI